MPGTIISSDDAFSTRELSVRASDTARFPAVRTPLSEVFTDVEYLTDRTAVIDVEAAALPALSDGTWGTVIPVTEVNRDRKSFALVPPKVGKTFDIKPGEIQSVRMTGEIDRESLMSVQDRKTGQVFLAVEDYHERARLAALQGNVINNAGTVLADLRSSAYFDVEANAVVGLELDATSPAPGALRQKFASLIRAVEDRLQIGQGVMSGLDVQANSDLFDLLRWHPETQEAFKRWEDLARPEGSPILPFRFAGVNFYDYRRAGLASGRGIAIPRGVPGMFKTIFTPGDFMKELNGPALPRYLSVRELDHDKGFEYEASTNAIHICNRLEAVFEIDAGDGL